MGQTQRITGRATRTTRENGITRVRYHDTDVVTFDDVTITLRTGGWWTVTTKARMNQTANEYALGFYVYQQNFQWFIKTKAGVIPFTSHTVTLDRETLRTANNPEEREAR